MHYKFRYLYGQICVEEGKGFQIYLTAGRIQIFFAGHWGTICSNGFTSSDAQGLCHILTGSSSVLAYGAVGDDNLE